MKRDRDAYIVIAPTGKSKIYSVACRKIGSRDRFTVIATCQHEVTADSIVDGLKILQGEVVAAENKVQLVLDEVRGQLTRERAKTDEARNKLHALEIGRRDTIRAKEEIISGLERQLRSAVLERDAAQKVAREEPARYMTSGPT